MTDQYDPYHLNPVTGESINQTIKFQKAAFEASRRGHWKKEQFFVATRDLVSGLHHGFVSNLEYELLSKLAKQTVGELEPEGGVVAWFRDEFLFNIASDGGFLRPLSDRILESGDSDHALFLWVRQKQLTDKTYLDRSNQHTDLPDPINSILSNKPQIGEVVHRWLRKLVDEITEDEKAKIGVVIRPLDPIGDHEKEIRRRDPALVQLGVVIYSDGDKEDCSPELGWIHDVLDTSAIATYSVYYERERYFLKALRQMARGQITKWGPRKGIGGQAKYLKAINDPPSHAAPFLLDFDPKNGDEPDDRPADEPGWYSMPKYTMPRLLDLIVSTGGFTKYEIAALSRSVFEHLKEFFWRGLIKYTGNQKNGTTAGILSALLVALEKSIIASDSIAKRTVKVKAGKAVILSDRVVKVDRRALLDDQPDDQQADQPDDKCMVTHLRNGTSVKAILDGQENDFEFELPENVLGTLGQELLDLAGDLPDGDLLGIGGLGKLHGDPHFENVFVDASVPEDPLIVMIDPQPPGLKEKWEDHKKLLGGILVPKELEKAVSENFHQIDEDPGYDIAKLLLSATGWYGLIASGAYSLKSLNFDGTQPELTMVWDDKEQVQPLSGAGGISGAFLIEDKAPAVKTARRDHQRIAENLIYHYLTAVSDTIEENTIKAQSVAMIRLWLFTLRHLFSIAEKLFPEEIEKAFLVYSVAGVLTTEGAKLLKGANLKKIESEETVKAFRKLLSNKERQIP